MPNDLLQEATDVFRALGLPKAQQNERSALTLLALLNLTPGKTWVDIEAPAVGITPIIAFMEMHYGKKYAPNTRETIRRFTVHPFVTAGIVVQNADNPQRSTNSPDNVYSVPHELIDVLRSYGSVEWNNRIEGWRQQVPALVERWARERRMNLIPVTLPDGRLVELSPGGQNPLIKAIVEEFCSRFTPGAVILYIGDTGDKFAVWEKEHLARLEVAIEEHGRMPDVIVHDSERGWLILIEAVTSHGPISPSRREQLAQIFAASTAGLVYVTAFLDRRTLNQYLGEISWETEVWIAETPTHLIHFDGERFLGPYD